MQKKHTPKTALVLAGGGLAGAAYEVGALRALDDLFCDFTVNDFDIYIGTSAGAIVASLLANGMRPETMLESVSGAASFAPMTADVLFHPNYRDWVRWVAHLPRTLFGTLKGFARHPRETTVFDVLWSLGDGFPAGLFDNAPLERYIRTILGKFGYSNDFRRVAAELHIVATRLETGTRAAFSKSFLPHVPISQAVAASTALPVLYKPVEIEGSEYVDGAARVNASLELALEQGAQLVICINPLVPFDHDAAADVTAQRLSRKGLTAVLKQLARISTHEGVHYRLKQLRRRYPDVDILVIEPSSRDDTMFESGIMNYSSRALIAEHSYERVTIQLAAAFARNQKMLAQYGIETRRALSQKQLRTIHSSGFDPGIVSDNVYAALPAGG